jgi:uncharacterized protein (TIGR02996 family)
VTMADDATFLRMLAERPDDLETLAVYADWLEERGEIVRAQILRLEQRLAGAPDIETARAMTKLAGDVPADWLAAIARPPLVGTCWEGTSDGKPITLRFLEGGTLSYTQYETTYVNGTWLQVGSAVALETNRHYADYHAVITGDEMRGAAVNIVNASWEWHTRRTVDAAFVEVTGDVITTVYDDHLRRRAEVETPPPPPPKKKPAKKKPAKKKPAKKKPAKKKPAKKKSAEKNSPTKPSRRPRSGTRPGSGT